MDSSTLLILNDDCLDNIFQYLKLDGLMLLFGQVHSRFDEAIERQLHRFPHLEFCMRFPPTYNDEQLQALGRHLQSIEMNVGYSTNPKQLLRILQHLSIGAAATGRLRALRIQHANITEDYIKVLLPVAPSLRELDLGICEIKSKHQFDLFLQAATQLQTLCLYNNDAVNLDEIVLSRLKCLKIRGLLDIPLLIDKTVMKQKYPHLSIICDPETGLSLPTLFSKNVLRI